MSHRLRISHKSLNLISSSSFRNFSLSKKLRVKRVPRRSAKKASDSSSQYDREEDYCPDGVTQMDPEVWGKYAKQVKESEGFDFEDFPGICTMASIVPIYFHDSPLEQQILTDLATIAIQEYNKPDQGTNYEFVEVEKANASVCSGFMYYITFRAEDKKISALKTFQAKVWDGIPASNIEVQFCRLK